MQKKKKKYSPRGGGKAIKSDQQPTQMLELANKVIKTFIITAFHI